VLVGIPTALWVAVRRQHGVIITIIGREIDPATMVIQSIEDPNAHLLGPKPEEA
jgi:hypothetical protein